MKLFNQLTSAVVCGLGIATMQVSYANEQKNPIMQDVQSMPDAQGAQSALSELAKDVVWQRLLFMEKERSSVTKSEFFLTNKDQEDLAYHELVAMANALSAPADHQSVICRFPARASWLADKLDLSVSFDECQALNDWYKNHAVIQLSLVFAEEHPNNLGSAFAHVLMKGDTENSLTNDDQTQALAINYTVARTPGDSEAGSGVKAMVGAYAGVMEFFEYTNKRDVYLKNDNRNVWEYRLNLSKEEVRQIMYHIWEVKDVERRYFFTHDNCATEILRLIDLVRPTENLRQASGRVTIPSEIVRLLSRRGLIDEVKFLPSEHSKQQALLNGANPNGTNDPANISSDYDPRQSQPTHRLNVGVGVFDDKAYGNLGIRSAYQDVLDNPAGVRKFLDLSILSLDAKIDEDNIKINNLTIASSRSYNPINTAKAYDGTAWGQYLMFKRVIDGADRDNLDHLVLHFGMEKGRSWTLGQGAMGTDDLADTLCYALLGGMGEVGNIHKGYRLGIAANLGCIHHMNDDMRVFGEVSLPYWYQGDNVGRDSYWLPSAKFGMQYDINRHHAIRLTGNVTHGYDETLHDVNVAWLNYF